MDAIFNPNAKEVKQCADWCSDHYNRDGLMHLSQTSVSSEILAEVDLFIRKKYSTAHEIRWEIRRDYLGHILKTSSFLADQVAPTLL